jgi:glycosyltransferase involved in cell wall biosynthesis
MAAALSSDPASPLVSVVLPTYNRRTLLSRAVGSIRAQTYSNWELIVVDDGSTDDSIERLPQDPRIHVVRLPHTGDLAAVRNAGLDASRGAIIGFVDSDDRWRPDKMARQVDRMQAPPAVDWCFCAYELVNEQDEVVPLRAGTPTISDEGDLFRTVLEGRAGISMQTVMVRREIALRVRFDPRVPFGEDVDFLVGVAHSGSAGCVPLPLVEVLDHAGRSSGARYDQSLHLAAAFRRYRLAATEASMRQICRRRSLHFTREYLRRARQHGRLLQGLAAAARMWTSRSGTI